jgi:dipeptidyl aminopeptidase/acylaminoacyl peptidase
MTKAYITLICSLFIVLSSKAQTAPPIRLAYFPIELEEIMKGYDFIGHVPENVRWSMTGRNILFEWNPTKQPGNITYAYNLNTKKTDSIVPSFYDRDDELNEYQEDIEYYTKEGGLYSFTRKSEKIELIYKSSSHVRNIHTNSNRTHVFFQTGMEVYCYDVKSKSIKLIFVFKKGAKPDGKDKNDHWTEEELELFQFHKDAKEKKEWNEKRNKQWSTFTPSYYFGDKSISNIQVFGNGRFMMFRVNQYPKTKETHVEHHISNDGHTYTSRARSKVNDKDPNHQLAVYDFEQDTVVFADFSTLSNIRKKAEYYKEYRDNESLFEEDRKLIMHRAYISPDGLKNVVDIRAYDNKDRWIVTIDPTTGKVTELETQHDEAWIGGPGISSWNMVPGNIGWFKDNEHFYFQSEATGYSHLYSMNIKSKEKKQLTSGNWEVHEARLSSNNKTFYIIANKIHPGNREFYHLDVATEKLSPVLTTEGNHEVSVSPDEKWLAIRYSYKNKPWEVYIAPNKPDAQMKQITHSTSPQFSRHQWTAPEVITFDAEDGQEIHARLYTPTNKKNGAAVIFVHGAGYLQNAHNWWSGYYREYMFHNFLAEQGYTILDIDYRASKGYGRDFRTAIYRNMGGKDLSDQIDGRQFLIDSLGIDADRIGIYGGSYGGFITLMALLTEPGKFGAGAAIRSVTDWYHYNHEYTSNILNYPNSDPDAYEKSSPIYFADNLEDPLLILHGMVDDNVQFQDVVRLSQRFIELGKKDWEMAVYPVEPHGFKKSSSWADEYRRIFELFNEELLIGK